MSALFSSKIAKVGLAVALIAGSFQAAAKQVTFEQYVGYNLSLRMLHVQLDIETQIEQEIYDTALDSLQKDSTRPTLRPVVSISEVADEDDEE